MGSTNLIVLIISPLLLLFISNQVTPSVTMLAGGRTDTKPADAKVEGIVDSLQPQFEQKAGEKFDEFKAVSYQSQVVAGTNYFVKVQVAPNKYAHVRIFVPLPMEVNPAPVAVAIQTNKTVDDPIGYF